MPGKAGQDSQSWMQINIFDKYMWQRERETEREGEVATSTIPPAVSVFTNVFVAVSRVL